MSAIAYVPELYHPDPDLLPPSTGEGSGGGSVGDYGGATPNFTPATEPWYAIDNSTGQIWWYYDADWH